MNNKIVGFFVLLIFTVSVFASSVNIFDGISSSSENLTFTGDENFTRNLTVDTDTIFSSATMNLSGDIILSENYNCSEGDETFISLETDGIYFYIAGITEDGLWLVNRVYKSTLLYDDSWNYTINASGEGGHSSFEDMTISKDNTSLFLVGSTNIHFDGLVIKVNISDMSQIWNYTFDDTYPNNYAGTRYTAVKSDNNNYTYIAGTTLSGFRPGTASIALVKLNPNGSLNYSITQTKGGTSGYPAPTSLIIDSSETYFYVASSGSGGNAFDIGKYYCINGTVAWRNFNLVNYQMGSLALNEDDGYVYAGGTNGISLLRLYSLNLSNGAIIGYAQKSYSIYASYRDLIFDGTNIYAFGYNSTSTNGYWMMDVFNTSNSIIKTYASDISTGSDLGRVGFLDDFIYFGGTYNDSVHTKKRIEKFCLLNCLENNYIQIGNTKVWNHTGEFNSTFSPNQTDDFSSILNTFLDDGNCTNGTLNGTDCIIPFIFHSDTVGILEYISSFSLSSSLSIISPENASYSDSLTNFFNASYVNRTGLQNSTLWIWNATSGDVIFNNGFRDISLQFTSSSTLKFFDYNDDNNTDIITMVSNSGYPLFSPAVVIHENDGNENFNSSVLTTASTLASLYNIEVIILGTSDVDDDGDIDVIFSGKGGGSATPYIVKNNGDGTFAAVQSVSAMSVATGYENAKVIDIEGDGDEDIILKHTGYDSTFIFINDGTGSYTRTIYANDYVNSYYNDLDEDGDYDIILVKPSLYWYENNGSESFTEHLIATNVTTNAGEIIVSDLDSDGDTDIITSNGYWYENNGTENFTAHEMYSATGNYKVSAADVNHDGNVDIVTSIYGEIQIYYNNGSESFTNFPISYQGGGSVQIGDIDNDSDYDIGLFKYSNFYGSALYKNINNYFVDDENTTSTEYIFSTAGTYSWNVELYDDDSTRLFSPNNFTLVIDTTPPVVSFLGVTSNLTYTDVNYFNVSGDVTADIRKNITFSMFYENSTLFDSNSTIVEIDSYNFSGIPDGNYTYSIEVCDVMDRCVTNSSVLIVDTTFPTYILNPSSSLGNYYGQENISVNISIIDDNYKNITIFLWNETALVESQNSLTYNFTGLLANDYIYNATFCDYSNNCNDTIEYSVSLKEPVVGIITPSSSQLITDTDLTTPIVITYSTNPTNATMDYCYYNITSDSTGSNNISTTNLTSCENTSVIMNVPDTSLSASYEYLLTICGYDTFSNLGCSNQTFYTKRVDAGGIVIGGGGGGGTTIITQAASNWSMETKSNTKKYVYAMSAGESRTDPLIFSNLEPTPVNITMMCSGALCNYITFSETKIDLGISQEIDTEITFVLELPTEFLADDYVTDIIAEDATGLTQVITLEVAAGGTIGIIFESFNKLGKTFALGGFNFPYAILYLLIFSVMLVVTYLGFGLKKIPLGLLFAILISFFTGFVPIIMI